MRHLFPQNTFRCLFPVNTFQRSPADVFAFVTDTLLHYPENTPHAGFHIPFQASRTVQVITGTGSAAFRFHVECIPNADCSTHGNHSGMRIFRLILPFMAVYGKAHIPWFICRHHGTEYNPVSRIGPENRRSGISVNPAAKYFRDSAFLFQTVCEPFGTVIISFFPCILCIC